MSADTIARLKITLDDVKPVLVRHSKIDRRMAEMGQTLPTRDFCRTAALPR